MINCCLKDPLHVLMRVLLCKIHCSLFCFCKPFTRIYTASSLKLENSPPHKSLKTLVSAIDDDDNEELVNHVDGHRNDVREEQEDGIVVEDSKEEEGQSVGDRDTLILKCSLRKFDSNSNSTETVKKEKKKVQWVDVMGIKALADIREFEPSEEDDIDSDQGKACVCVIL